MRLLTSTVEVAGRIDPKTSPCARPTSSHRPMSVTNIRVRHVFDGCAHLFEGRHDPAQSLQEWVKGSGARLVVIFEGRDAAGKGGAIKRITQFLNTRVARIVALPAPTDRQRGQWYFHRYVEHLPARGEIVLFDRS
jgi:polyphosphate kinase 2 (PPK2 family)